MDPLKRIYPPEDPPPADTSSSEDPLIEVMREVLCSSDPSIFVRATLRLAACSPGSLDKAKPCLDKAKSCLERFKRFNRGDLLNVIHATCASFAKEEVDRSIHTYPGHRHPVCPDAQYADMFSGNLSIVGQEYRVMSDNGRALACVLRNGRKCEIAALFGSDGFAQWFDLVKPAIIWNGCLKVLVKAGFNINFSTKSRGSLLVRAIADADAVRRLFEMGADTETYTSRGDGSMIDGSGRSVLEFACNRARPNLDVIETIMKHIRMGSTTWHGVLVWDRPFVISDSAGRAIDENLWQCERPGDREKIRRIFARFRMRMFARAQVSPRSPAREFSTNQFLMAYVGRLMWSDAVVPVP